MIWSRPVSVSKIFRPKIAPWSLLEIVPHNIIAAESLAVHGTRWGVSEDNAPVIGASACPILILLVLRNLISAVAQNPLCHGGERVAVASYLRGRTFVRRVSGD